MTKPIHTPLMGARRRRLFTRRPARWHEAPRTRAAILVATIVLAAGPFLFMAYENDGRLAHLSGRALAAANFWGGEHPKVLQSRSAQDRNGDIITLRSLVSDDPNTLLDMVDDEIVAVFSTPDLQRREGPARVWQFRNNNCVLDVFFREKRARPESAPISRVVHFETRPRSAGETCGVKDLIR